LPLEEAQARPEVTCTENTVKVGRVFLGMRAVCKNRQTDKQTDTPIAILRTFTGDEIRIAANYNKWSSALASVTADAQS